MRKKIISKTLRTCAVVLIVSGSVIGADGGQFKPVEPNRIPEILSMISTRVRDNYECIKTWEGQVSVTRDYIYEGDRAEKIFKEDTDGKGEIPKAIGKHKETAIEFSLDAEKDFLYANYYSNSHKPLQYMDLESGRDLGAKRTHTIRSGIITPEYQVDCMGYMRRGGIIISRKAIKQARPKNSSKCNSNILPVYDPRTSFKAFKDQIWELFPELSEIIKKDGKYSVDAYDLRVEERKSGDTTTEYRIILPSKAGSPESYLYVFSTMVFSSDKGFNIISYQHTAQNGIMFRNLTWDYDLVDGVHVPIERTQQDFNWPDGSVRYESKLSFKNQKVNKPIPAETFTCKNLGLKDGDIFEDKTVNKKYHYHEATKTLEPISE